MVGRGLRLIRVFSFKSIRLEPRLKRLVLSGCWRVRGRVGMGPRHFQLGRNRIYPVTLPVGRAFVQRLLPMLRIPSSVMMVGRRHVPDASRSIRPPALGKAGPSI